jgi:GT2 family glycosyltransferase
MKLSIIIVNWNTKDLLRQCLASLFSRELGMGCEVIVVDNASSDGSASMVEQDFPAVMLLQNTANVGFAKANNQAVKLARGEYILLLNSDTIIGDNGIFRLWTAFMDEHPEAGASGAKLVFQDGGHQVGDAGYKPSLASVFNYTFFLSRLSPLRRKGLFLSYATLPDTIEVDWISGAAFLVRRSILDRTGLLNEDIFMFAEDIEWGCRIRSYGYKVYYLSFLEIVHLQGASTAKQKDQRSFSVMWLKNVRRYYRACNPRQPLLFYDSLTSAGFLMRTAIYSLFFLLTGKPRARQKALRMFHYFRYSLSVLWGRDGKGQ